MSDHNIISKGNKGGYVTLRFNNSGSSWLHEANVTGETVNSMRIVNALWSANGVADAVGGAARADMGDAPQSGLLIHSRADTDVTVATGVSDWGNSVGVNLLQATSGNQPSYDATETVGTLANAGAITFDGTSDWLKTFANNGSNTTSHHFMVIKPITWATGTNLLESDGGSASHLKQAGSTPQISIAGDALTVSYTNFTLGEWALLDCLWDGGTANWHLGRNDDAVTTGSGGGSGWSSSITLGANDSGGSGYCNFAIAEWLAYDDELADSTDVKNYLNDQYGLW